MILLIELKVNKKKQKYLLKLLFATDFKNFDFKIFKLV